MSAGGAHDSPGPGTPPAPRPAGVRRSGRRPGDGDTREVILAAARACFAERGYDRATIRGIAAAAAVDPALVLHYFGSKTALFGAAVELPVVPETILRGAIAGDREQIGATIVRRFLEAWEPLETRPQLIAMFRSATTNDTAMGMIRDLLTREVFGPITEILGVPDARLRATLVASQLVGLAIMRYVGRLEPIASAPTDDLVAAIGPTIQRYVAGDIGPERETG